MKEGTVKFTTTKFGNVSMEELIKELESSMVATKELLDQARAKDDEELQNGLISSEEWCSRSELCSDQMAWLHFQIVLENTLHFIRGEAPSIVGVSNGYRKEK
jgi:hypothetical protein